MGLKTTISKNIRIAKDKAECENRQWQRLRYRKMTDRNI